MNDEPKQQSIAAICTKLGILAVAMFAFCLFVMPPLYTLFCEITGINGKTKGKYEYTAVPAQVDTSRLIKVKFVAANNKNMPWEFKPSEFEIEVHPGEAVTTFFDAFNPTQKDMVGQAIPSLVPKNAVSYFNKTECFCFNQQVLTAGERAKLGLQFIVDQEVPKNVKTIILSYTLFDVTARMPEAIENAKKQKAGRLSRKNIYTDTFAWNTF